MEWKEHIAWIAPLLATAVAFAVTYYGTSLIRHQGVRRTLLVFFTASFLIAGVAGALGAFITKAAPVH
jgi:ssDNA-specific exonuclease RecJ